MHYAECMTISLVLAVLNETRIIKSLFCCEMFVVCTHIYWQKDLAIYNCYLRLDVLLLYICSYASISLIKHMQGK